MEHIFTDATGAFSLYSFVYTNQRYNTAVSGLEFYMVFICIYMEHWDFLS